jgi:hypothetical protein
MAIVEVLNNYPKGFATILGDAFVGETLIARPNAVSDADGIAYETITFQWLRDGVEIEGATGTTYDVSGLDVGGRLSVRMSYTDLGGTVEVLTSDPEPVVPAAGTPIPDETEPLNDLVILGNAEVGGRLIARPNGVTDENGIDYETAAFQWLRDGEPITGATDQVYYVTEADSDAQISVQYSYQDLQGQAHTLTSNPKPKVPVSEPDQDGIDLPPAEVEGTDNILLGTTDADRLVAQSGIEKIDGLDGIDTAVFAGDQSNYTVVFDTGSVRVMDKVDGGLGSITLDSIELIDFDTKISIFDTAVELDELGGSSKLNAAELESLVELYIAYFNRAPDAIGLNFWSNCYAEGMTLESIAALFADQPETRAAYPEDVTDTSFVTSVYDNVLNRAPDTAGLDFWVEALETQAVSRDQFILELLKGARSDVAAPEDDGFVDQQMADRAYLESKIDIGSYFAVHKGMSDVDNASEVMALFDGSQESLNDAFEAIEGHYTDALSADGAEFLLQVIGVLDDPFMV